jgi:hypothetical protein
MERVRSPYGRVGRGLECMGLVCPISVQYPLYARYAYGSAYPAKTVQAGVTRCNPCLPYALTVPTLQAASVTRSPYVPTLPYVGQGLYSACLA